MCSVLTDPHLRLSVSPSWVKLDKKTHQNSAMLALCEGIPPVTGGIPSQRASNAEKVSMQWRPRENKFFTPSLIVPLMLHIPTGMHIYVHIQTYISIAYWYILLLSTPICATYYAWWIHNRFIPVIGVSAWNIFNYLAPFPMHHRSVHKRKFSTIRESLSLALSILD